MGLQVAIGYISLVFITKCSYVRPIHGLLSFIQSNNLGLLSIVHYKFSKFGGIFSDHFNGINL